MGGVETSREVRAGEGVHAAELLAAEHDHGGTLGGTAPLMDITRDGGNAGNTEVDNGLLHTSLLHELDQEPSEAGVDVEADIVGDGNL